MEKKVYFVFLMILLILNRLKRQKDPDKQLFYFGIGISTSKTSGNDPDKYCTWCGTSSKSSTKTPQNAKFWPKLRFFRFCRAVAPKIGPVALFSQGDFERACQGLSIETKKPKKFEWEVGRRRLAKRYKIVP